ncbi:unnamed protein product [Brassica oleracea var. botrytis]
MSQLAARTGLRALLVHSRVNRNMFMRCVSAVKNGEDTKKPMPVHDWCGGFVGFNIRSEHVQVYLIGDFNMRWRRMCSASATEKKDEKPRIDKVKKDQDGGGSVAVPSYWGIETAKMKIARKDGSKWPWNCFMPWETHQADLTIDFKKHHVPENMADKIAYVIVQILHHFTFKSSYKTLLFCPQRRYGCRAMMLETVAAVPGMVGGMILHLKSIRRFEHSGGWIKALLEEAENERMHLMTMMELVKPKWYERLLVILVQGVFFSSFFTCYVVSPRLAHRIVRYLEEEAIHSYTEFLKDIDDGKIENVKAPAIAIDYWRLPEDATLKDVVTVIRADEAHHRDVNHFASDIRNQGKELREAAAPIVRKEELWNRLQSHGGQEAVVLEGEVAVPVGGPEMIIGKERDYRKRSRRCSASPARRSRSPRSASPPKASHEMRRSKERSLTPLPRSRSPRSPSLEKASPERKRNDRFPSPRDKARSQSPYADVGNSTLYTKNHQWKLISELCSVISLAGMTAYLRRRHGVSKHVCLC